MKAEEVKEIARHHGIKPGRLGKGEVIRAIQVAEGNAPCFGIGQAEVCGQHTCLWREDCR